MIASNVPMPDLTGWAARQLGIDTGLPQPELRRQFLARLADADFVPPVNWSVAFTLLDRPRTPVAAPAMAGAWADEHERLAEAVEAFAAEFFTLPPDQRMARWKELHACCQFSTALKRRLAMLTDGLSVSAEVTPTASPELRELAREVAAGFVLPRAARTDHWQQLRGAWRDRKEVVVELHAALPELAALEADELRAIVVPRRVAKLKPPQPPSKAASGRRSSIPYIGLLVVGLSILRALGSISSPSKVEPRRFQYQPAPSPPYRSAWERKTDHEKALQEIMDTIQAETGGLPLPGAGSAIPKTAEPAPGGSEGPPKTAPSKP